MINVTKTFFPPLDSYTKLLKRIWESQWLTNRGELVLELEEKIKNYLNVNQMILMTNGTLPIQIALKILVPKDSEVITTPFSYVATTSSILWENGTPVFVDIDPEFLTIDPAKIEAAITPKTKAILATHVFGNPCDVDAIELIAKKHHLKVIYDAAHCFGVTYKGKSIFEYGDASTCSFHATKIFHTGEGGAIFTTDKDLLHQFYYSHNFGHNGPLDFHGLGINAKISELQAAMGLAVFEHLPEIIKNRKQTVDFYTNHLDFSLLKSMKIRENTIWNYHYFPVIFQTESQLLEVQKILNENKIFPRRYFYPSLNTIHFVNGAEMPVSEAIASKILCLPLSASDNIEDLENIVQLINKTIK